MAIRGTTRTLRNSPEGNQLVAIAKAGDRVQILDDASNNPPWIKVLLRDLPGQPEGWVSVDAVDPNADAALGPLDKLLFAMECARQAEEFGVSDHYLMAVAELRTRVTNLAGVASAFGPFALTADEWAFFNALPDLALELEPAAICSWRAQCAVFAAMASRQQKRIAKLLGGQPTASELYLAQICGAAVAAGAHRDQTRTIAELVAGVAVADFAAEGIDPGGVAMRYAKLLTGPTARYDIVTINDALQAALDMTRPFVVQVGGPALASATDGLPAPLAATAIPSAAAPANVPDGWSRADLVSQVKVAKAKGWLPLFHKAARDYEIPAEVLIAIASRESGVANVVGDHGKGYGLMRIDVGGYPEWCASGVWRDPNAGIQKGAQILDSKREEIRNSQGRIVSIAGRPFRGAPIPDENVLLTISVAAYDNGLWPYYSFSNNTAIDRYTTRGNYSADVKARASVIKTLL
jgi:hypothetical protein